MPYDGTPNTPYGLVRITDSSLMEISTSICLECLVPVGNKAFS